MKNILFKVLCVLTSLSVLCTCYVIIDYMRYDTSRQYKYVETIEEEIDGVETKIDDVNKKKEEFEKENSEKVGKLELWQKELEKVD